MVFDFLFGGYFFFIMVVVEDISLLSFCLKFFLKMMYICFFIFLFGRWFVFFCDINFEIVVVNVDWVLEDKIFIVLLIVFLMVFWMVEGSCIICIFFNKLIIGCVLRFGCFLVRFSGIIYLDSLGDSLERILFVVVIIVLMLRLLFMVMVELEIVRIGLVIGRCNVG